MLCVVRHYPDNMDQECLSATVIANINTMMDKRGITAAELARLAGINASGVYDILTSRSRSPRLDTLDKIAAALGLLVEDLIDPDLLNAQGELDVGREIRGLVSRLPEDDQRRLHVMIRAWADTR